MLPGNSSSQAVDAGQASQAAAVEVQAQEVDQVNAQTEQAKQEPKFDEALYRKIAREEAAKVAQSFTAKAENRIGERVQEQIRALEMSQKVLGLSDAQVDAAKQQIAIQAMIAKPEAETPAGALQQSQTANPNQPQLHPAIADALSMMEAEKTSIDEGDPEFTKFIKPHFGEAELNGSKFRMDVARAIDAKQARLNAQKETAPARSPGGAGGGGPIDPNDIAKITDSAELYRLGEKRMRAGK
ncbi:hypothetical protein CCP3SC15_450002 [Gammaproteobacteria bacterium]